MNCHLERLGYSIDTIAPVTISDAAPFKMVLAQAFNDHGLTMVFAHKHTILIWIKTQHIVMRSPIETAVARAHLFVCYVFYDRAFTAHVVSMMSHAMLGRLVSNALVQRWIA
jgi:hypothetical protein